MRKYTHLPIIDMHMHILSPHSTAKPEYYQQPEILNAQCMIDKLGWLDLKAMNILAVTLFDKEDLVTNPLTLYTKTLAPDKIYTFTGLRRELTSFEHPNMREQLISLLDTGFDGVKMICKPNVRKKWNVKINDPVFFDFYAYMEEHRVPLLFHVGDPEYFWDPERTPDWAKDRGWYYGDDKDLPTMEEMYAETDDLLRRYPLLNVCFPHFHFMSANLPRVQSMFDTYPNVRFDLTPNPDMYVDFSNNLAAAREFFIKNHNKILMGTDSVGAPTRLIIDPDKEKPEHTIHGIIRFLESDGPMELFGETVHGLGLPEEVCRRIFADNFLDFVGGMPPKPVNRDRAVKLCQEYLELLGGQTDTHTGRMLQELSSLLKG